MTKAVFLDRDGTINQEVEYLDNLSDLSLIQGVHEGIRTLNQADFMVVVITNQSGVARGYFDEGFVDTVHRELGKQLERAGARVDKWYFCPHHPEAGRAPYRQICTCRKPATGMLEQAVQEFDIDLTHSYMVGDSLSDLQTAWNAGISSILVLTGHGRKTVAALSKAELQRIDYIAKDLLDACRWITRG